MLMENDTRGKSIIELGAGYSGLAGILIANALIQSGMSLSRLEITDGNEVCSERIEQNVLLNKALIKDNTNPEPNQSIYESVTSSQLVWDRNFKTATKYNFVLLADGLFFEKFHEDLVHTISELLDQNGKCIIAAPERGGSRERFFKRCLDYFDIVDVQPSEVLKTNFENLKVQCPTLELDRAEIFLNILTAKTV